MGCVTFSDLPAGTVIDPNSLTAVSTFNSPGNYASEKFTFCNLSCCLGGGIVIAGDGPGSTARCSATSSASGAYSTNISGNGSANNDSSVVAGGLYATANGDYATASAGYSILASGNFSTTSGGYYNSSSGDFSTTSGGSGVHAVGIYSTAKGGAANTANAGNSTVGGGNGNCALTAGSVVGGGIKNTACGEFTTISGGCYNTTHGLVTGCDSIIVGGCCNISDGLFSGILGGGCNNLVAKCCTYILASGICNTNGNGITVTNKLAIKTIATSSAGLPGGSVYRDSLTSILKYVP